MKNAADTKLVKNLAKYRRFSIGSLRKIADWLHYFIEYFRYTVIFHIFAVLCLFLFLQTMNQITAYNHMVTVMNVKNFAISTQLDPQCIFTQIWLSKDILLVEIRISHPDLYAC